jgi:hypothetical protein
MIFNALAVSYLMVTSLAVAEPAPYKLGSMSFNRAFGLAKRQAGYAPSQTYCGPGTDCASSCGTGYIQCASTDSDLHCYNPEIKQTCCPDGNGNSCDDGYFCTSDTTGGTWCCPDVRFISFTFRILALLTMTLGNVSCSLRCRIQLDRCPC